ncbi:hypothetical protein [Frondihabitans australicus]|uniref:Uncharacterized protein n=1 Tax=Frondihabitans australicus TaxID=386892 RepID=A0A495IL63_9MICO|nr:hypothetical protein [Frondihabitans australicus]RKR76509.1 hypothetical protein C8E83_3686 [Frondihabitans australicus]
MVEDSHYHRQPGVSPVRIQVYPKRKLSDLPPGLRTIPAERPLRLTSDTAATYADFFSGGRSSGMASFSHIADDDGLAADRAADEGRALAEEHNQETDPIGA